MNKPVKYTSLQTMQPAFIMKAGAHDSEEYWIHQPRAPDITIFLNEFGNDI